MRGPQAAPRLRVGRTRGSDISDRDLGTRRERSRHTRVVYLSMRDRPALRRAKSSSLVERFLALIRVASVPAAHAYVPMRGREAVTAEEQCSQDIMVARYLDTYAELIYAETEGVSA